MVRAWPSALTIAGSDSGGGAGIEADLRTFAAFEIWGAVAVTAVTAQTLGGVSDSTVMRPSLVSAQIGAAVETAGPLGAVKTGMLGDAAVVNAVADAIEHHALHHVVVDPVQAATGGGRLLDDRALPVMIDRLLPQCTVLTPNIPEAAALLGSRVDSRDEMPEAAAALAELGPEAVLLKGGHLRSPGSPDVLWHHGRALWLESPRFEVAHSHGTGCTLSAAVAAGLARGAPIEDSCRAAKAYVGRCLDALRIGRR